MAERSFEAAEVASSNLALGKEIGVLELVDSFHLGWNGFIAVQVQLLLPIYIKSLNAF